MAIEKIIDFLFSASNRCSDENAHRMEHERTFIRRDIQDAINVITAIKENDQTMRKSTNR